MSGMFKKAVGLALALIIIAMCAVSALAAQETEPNNTIVTASTISVNTIVYGSTNDKDMDDWYKFTVNQDGYIQINFTHDYGVARQDIYLYYYDGESKKIYYSFNIKSDYEKKDSINYAISKGTYYILISNYYKIHNKTLNYNFKINFFISDDWEKEFNDSIVTANSISVGRTVYGSNNYRHDYVHDTDDWYKFTINQDGYVWIDFTHKYNKTNHRVYLYSYDGSSKKELLNSLVHLNSENETSSKVSLSKGTYYLFIEEGSKVDTTYSFKVNFSTSSGGGSSSGGSTAPSKAPNTQSTTTTTKHSTAVSSSDYINITADNNAQTYQSGNFYYYIDVNYNIVINNYSGSDTYVEIPSEINGKPVIGIADNAFAGTTAQIIYVPSSVSQFGQNAFGQNDGESREIMCEDGSYAQAYADSNGIANETVADKNEASSNAAAKKNKAEKKTAESKNKKFSTPMIIIICVAAAAIIAVVVVIIVMSHKKNEFEADNGFKYKQ